MTDEQKQINLAEYGYTADTKIEIPAAVFMALMNFTGKIKDKELVEVLNAQVPKKISKGEVTWKEATPQEFFTQQTKPAYTIAGAQALDLEFTLKQIHLQNIQNEIAKPVEELKAKFVNKEADE